MERDNPLDDLSDERLLELFRSVDAPSPSPDFALRTMRAVMRDPVPAGRKALRDPLTSMFGWAAVIAAVALSVLALALTPADRRREFFAAHHARRRHGRVAHAVHADCRTGARRAYDDGRRGVAGRWSRRKERPAWC